MPASPSTARAINDRLALRLLQQEGPLTAGQLKQLTGLSRPTVADLVERLTASGLIEMVGESGEQRRGPNARLYGLVADRAYLAALDVRLEGVSVVVSDLVGRVLAEASVPIDGASGTGPAVEQAVALVERAAKEAGAERLHTVGVGAPASSTPPRANSATPPACPPGTAASSPPSTNASPAPTSSSRTRPTSRPSPNNATARPTTATRSSCSGSGWASARRWSWTGRCARGRRGCGEIGFLPVPGTRGFPSATDCEGGFHSLAGAAAVLELARECGVLGSAGRGLGRPGWFGGLWGR